MGNRTNTTITGRTPTSGSPASAMYATNTVNQYVSITGIAAPITHDANGNLTLQNQNTYTWDSHNRLLSLVPNSPAIGDKALHHGYDGLHRRVWSQVREWNGSSWINLDTTRFRYDAWNVVEEYNIVANTQTLVRTRTWGSDLSGSLQGAGGVGGLLLTEEINGSNTTAYHHHYDGNGNVTEITTGLTAASAASYRYDAFGNTLVATGPYASTNKYRFSTKPLNSEVTNAPLYYYGYRYYDPVTGRWPSRDPIAEKGGLNLYGFVENDGINRWDYLGLSCKQDCKNTAKRKGTGIIAMAVVMATGCFALPPPASFICYGGVIVWETSELLGVTEERDKCIKNCKCESEPSA
jgi:RHS repeat-associated protein